MAAEFDNTSFGIQRRRKDAAELSKARQLVDERVGFVKDLGKIQRLVALRVAIDNVLEDLKD